jgi:thiol-disulfide isomerase/thioredoxin
MKKETKRQLMVLFVLLTFLASSITYAVLSVVYTPQEEKRVIYEYPLNEKKEAEFLRKGKVIIQFFWNDECANCSEYIQTLFDVVDKFQGNVILELINTFEHPYVDVLEIPAIYLKGKSLETYNELLSRDELEEKLCELFFEKPEICEEIETKS